MWIADHPLRKATMGSTPADPPSRYPTCSGWGYPVIRVGLWS